MSCVIVGAGPGIGQALGMAFAREGMDVALISRRPERLITLTTEIAWKTGRQVRTYAADAGESGSLLAALSAAQSDLGTPRVLIYNAASVHKSRPLALDVESLMHELRVNVGGALTAAQAVSPVMRAAGAGSILFTGGSLADAPSATYASLSMGKAALKNLTHTLAQELGEHGIHVATVTVHGFVQAGTRFDPALIAQQFVQLHHQPRGHFELERIYK